MVKINHVKDYLKTGIVDSIDNCAEFSNEELSSFSVEFTDWSMGGDKTKYRVTIEHLN